jgi:hypothetical protein
MKKSKFTVLKAESGWRIQQREKSALIYISKEQAFIGAVGEAKKAMDRGESVEIIVPAQRPIK